MNRLSQSLSRREMLKMVGAGAAGALLAACGPTTPEVVEKVVTKEVEKVVKETVVVEQKVEKEVVVEKVVTPTPGPVTLRFAHAMGDEGQAVFEKVAAKFQEKNPIVTVKVEPTFDWDAQRYLVQAAAGTAPDILWGDEHFVYILCSKGALLDLGPFMEKSGFKKDDFDPLFQYFEFLGKLYGVALWSGCYVIFYNKQLFDEAGVSYPTEGWVYDDLLTAAKQITKDTNGDGEPDTWGFHCQTDWANPWGALTWAFGGDYFNEDGTQFLLCESPNYAGLQWYIDLMHVHKVAPTPETADALAGGGDPFTLGLIGLKTGSPWRMTTYRQITEFGWGVAPMPKGPNGRYSALTTDSLSIYSQSKAPDATWALMEELLSEEAAQIYCTEFKGPVPALKAGQKYFVLPDQPPANQQVFIDAVTYAKVPMQSPYSYVVEEPFYQALGAAADGTKSLDEAMSGVCASINEILQAEVEKVKSYSG